jgi:hypothetical protein
MRARPAKRGLKMLELWRNGVTNATRTRAPQVTHKADGGALCDLRHMDFGLSRAGGLSGAFP